MVDGQEQFDPTQTSAQQIYEQEDNVHKARLIESDYRQSLSQLIFQEALTMRCKIALISFINQSFDKNAILAINTSLAQRKLEFEIGLNKTRLSYSRTDAMNPIMPSLHQNIRGHFSDFVSRSLKGDERNKQADRSTTQKVEYNDRRNRQEPKRGFGLNPFAKKEEEEDR